jgi:hypothetical protein
LYQNDTQFLCYIVLRFRCERAVVGVVGAECRGERAGADKESGISVFSVEIFVTGPSLIAPPADAFDELEDSPHKQEDPDHCDPVGPSVHPDNFHNDETDE